MNLNSQNKGSNFSVHEFTINTGGTDQNTCYLIHGWINHFRLIIGPEGSAVYHKMRKVKFQEWRCFYTALNWLLIKMLIVYSLYEYMENIDFKAPHD